ncbi:MAG: hypothetical protein OXH92_02230 [Bryobacterales bacterium]|nr:hypothetical protein [Bryobacterales bacterium]MDE0432804.1 hypothetical protein [Bryobacterales bacterium]
MDPNRNASPGWVVFQRTTMTCTEDYGDGDRASGLSIEIPDGVPTQDKRSFIGGTLVVEKETAHRTFVTAGQVILRFLTPNSTFAASWWLTVKWGESFPAGRSWTERGAAGQPLLKSF